jgi:hypothetical protein
MTKNVHGSTASPSMKEGVRTKKTATGIDYSSPRKHSGLSVFSPLSGRKKL